MLNEEQLLQAVSGVRPEDILAAGQALGYLPRAPRRHCWRPLLIAAVLTVLMAATAVAAGLLGRAERLATCWPFRPSSSYITSRNIPRRRRASSGRHCFPSSSWG